jgi:hypothetical protein
MALLLWFAYQRGIAAGGWQSAANARDRRELLNRIDALENETGTLNAKIRSSRCHGRLDKQAYGQVERTLGELQSAMSRESDDLAFYKSIVSPADGISGLRIQRFEVAQGAEGPPVPAAAYADPGHAARHHRGWTRANRAERPAGRAADPLYCR